MIRKWSSCAVVASGLALLVPPVALAQESTDPAARRVIDELIVTATRREATLQDVPVSVGVVTGEQIRELSLQNLDQLSAYVPGLTVQEGGEQTGISIRGFGAGLNFGFDQSVGLFIDGIYAGRERQFRGTFLDVSRVEVLRGPQATLFGKNTISGAIIVTTGQPSHEFGLDLFAEATSEIDRQNYQAVVTGGLTDDLAARLAVRFSDEKGHMRNTFTGQREEQQQDWIARATFLWTPMDNVAVRTKLERSEYERSGRGFNVSNVSGLAVGKPTATGADVSIVAQLPTYRRYDPNFPVRDKSRSSKQLETADVTSTNAVVKIDYTLANGGVLSSTTGFSGYDSEDQRDVDWTPTNYLYEPISQEFTQWSQEFQFVSEVGDRFDYIVGLHAFRNDFYVDRRTDINIEPFLGPGVPPFSDVIFGEPADVWQRSNLRFLDQETTSWSTYGSGTFHMTDQWSLTAGLRYNWERKEADDRQFLGHFGRTAFLELDQAVIDFMVATPANLAGTLPADEAARLQLVDLANSLGGDNLKVASVCASFAFGQCGQMQNIVRNSRRGSGTVTEADWSPELTIAYDLSTDAMFYGKLTRGHKGGGFNSNATGQDVDPTFEPEQVTGYELGGKLRLLGGIANLNFSVFRLDFDNLQVSVWTGNNFDVGNAGKARSQGLEMDGTWLITDRLQFNGSLIWLDARYRDFADAACSVPQLTFGEPGCNVTGVTPTGAPLMTQDLSGKRFAPTLSGNLGLGYVADVTSSMELLLRADASHSGRQRNSRDPTIAQGSRTIVDLGATLRPIGLRSWSLGLLLQNATDKGFYYYEFEAPVQAGTRIGFPGPPRRVTLRASYHM